MGEVEAFVSPGSRDLHIEEDLRFQRKEWVVQRIGMALLFLFVTAAALGLTGMGGPLSRGEAGVRTDPVFVEFARFTRRGTTTTLKVHLRTAPGEIRFWISDLYFDHVRLVRVVPEPLSVTVAPGRYVYAIGSASPEVTIAVDVEHEAVGNIEAAIGLEGGHAVRVNQWTLF